MEQNIFESEPIFDSSDGDASLKQKWRSLSNTASSVTENENGCFECNICLDSANEPVVTLCGHLYCWPCIYKWLQVQSNSDEPDQQNCPVCKAHISHASLVPLYGRGATRPAHPESKKPQLGLVIPRRPLPSGTSPAPQAQPQHLNPGYFAPSSRPFHHQQYFSHHPYGAAHHHLGGGAVTTSLISPTIGVFGEMVFTRIFGGSGAGLLPYPMTATTTMAGSGSPRMRRQEVQVDKSLNRVSIFLFCCIFLCLLLF